MACSARRRPTHMQGAAAPALTGRPAQVPVYAHVKEVLGKSGRREALEINYMQCAPERPRAGALRSHTCVAGVGARKGRRIPASHVWLLAPRAAPGASRAPGAVRQPAERRPSGMRADAR